MKMKWMRIEMLANIIVESAHWSRLLPKNKVRTIMEMAAKVVTIAGTAKKDHILNADSRN